MKALALWTATASVGNPDIDRQHRSIFLLWQKAYGLLDATPRDAHCIHEALNGVIASMRECFAAEEKILTRNGCTFQTMHAAEHSAFGERLTSLIYGPTVDKEELLLVWTDWAYVHVADMDVLCRCCLEPSSAEGVCKRESLTARLKAAAGLA